MKNIDPFVEKIRDLEYKCKPIPAWASWRRERIRIAIIDTGIDYEDIHVEIARDVGRIKDYNCRGFLKDADDYQDRHGHGTRVARLILGLAPSAELYIAKISNDKSIESKHLSRISEVG
jgi:subtilisin family serine protease